MTPRKPHTQKKRSIRFPKWEKEDLMDSAYLAGLIDDDTWQHAKQWITEMREGNHPAAMYSTPENKLRNEGPDGAIAKIPTNKHDLASFIFTYAPGGSAFWSNINYAIGCLENPQYGPANAKNRLQARITYMRNIGVLKPHTAKFILDTFIKLEQGAYPKADYDPDSPTLDNAFRWFEVSPGYAFWRYINFLDEKINT